MLSTEKIKLVNVLSDFRYVILLDLNKYACEMHLKIETVSKSLHKACNIA